MPRFRSGSDPVPGPLRTAKSLVAAVRTSAREGGRVDVELAEAGAVRAVRPAGLAVAALDPQRTDQVQVGHLVVRVDVEDPEVVAKGLTVLALLLGELAEGPGRLDEGVPGQFPRPGRPVGVGIVGAEVAEVAGRRLGEDLGPLVL